MSRFITAGIDIGTAFTRVVVGEEKRSDGALHKAVAGIGIAKSKGVRHGFVVNPAEVSRSVAHALRQAEESAGTRIRRVHLAIGGTGLDGIPTEGSAIISRADSKIGELDVERTLEAAERALPKSDSQNREILHNIPIAYKIDGKDIPGNPAGMEGLKLEVKTLAVTVLTRHLNDLILAVEEVGVEVEDIVASPLASGLVNTSKTHKIAGVIVADIGAETTATVMYEDNIPMALKVFPVGSNDVTNDIALGLKIPLEEAEKLKLNAARQTEYSQKQLDTIIAARAKDILDLIDAHLKKNKRKGLLPAGIVFTGGGAGISGIAELAKNKLDIPSRAAELSIATPKGVIRDPAWSVAYGLAMLGLVAPEEEPHGFQVARHTKDSLVSWVKKFLP